MMFTNLEMWLLGWVIVVSVLGNLALLFSLFKKTEKVSEPLIFLAMAVAIPLLMFFWVVNEIFKRIDSRREKKRKDFSEKMNERSWADKFIFLDNLDEGPVWVLYALEKKQIYFRGPDLIVKTSHGDVKVNHEDAILIYGDDSLGVLPKDLNQEVSAHE